MQGRKEQILDKALELFNANGIEYVGMRELAAELGMRIGNITYYYPTKDDLVFAISQAYSDSNTAIHNSFPVNGIYDFLTKFEKIYENGVRYRSLMLSMVHIMERNEKVAENYRKVAQMRTSNMAHAMKRLEEEKHLQVADGDVEWFLVAVNSLIARFWFSEASLSTKRSKLDTRIGYYTRMQAQLLKPYATKKGLKDIERFMAERKL
jgi:AcrR family transcriptional regulator